MTVLIRIFHFFIFSSLYIALCATLMVWQTDQLLHLHYHDTRFLFFVFFSTVCSYNFHWYLTPHAHSENIRENWMATHRHYNFYFFLTGLTLSVVLFFYFLPHWWAMAIAAVLTFLYSAPKIPLPVFAWLRKIAVGKTLFLAFVWMYVTTLLPVLVSGKPLDGTAWLFAGSRFFLIYAICILFDYRDREDDILEGIRSTITFFKERQINILFVISLLLFAATTLLLLNAGFTLWQVTALLLPGIITALLYPVAKKNFSDYLYYVVLDGLMMFSALLTPFLPF